MLEIGSLVDGKYKILNEVGHGGMSIVYLAMNEKANKQWAIKEVRKDGVKDFEVVKQSLVAETDMLKKLNHPYLPDIVDVIEDDDRFLIVMDYIQGNSLSKAIEEYGALPQDDVIHWAKQLCDVLGYLHSQNPPIIYRDMKPANIMLKPDGNITLIDFGTAREFKEKNLADTTCLGTMGYAAPEQFGGMGQTDGRTDIYCLGATLYHLVTGKNPCEPPYEIRPIREINPSLSGGLERIILKCTQPNPANRYQNAAELMYALEHYDEIDDIYRKKQKRKLAAFITTSVITVILGATSIWGYVSAENKKSENYDNILKTADTYEDYYNAIITDPTRTDAYLKLNDMLTSDFVLDKESRTATVKVTERNFDPAKVIPVIEASAGGAPSISGWTTVSGSGNGDDTVNIATIYYGNDADYTFNISAEDIVGNKSGDVNYGNSLAPTKFTVDKTVPVISVAYDNNNAAEAGFYKEQRTATVTIQEHNFETSRVVLTMNATDNGNPASAPTISGWSGSGDTHTATISFASDAVYTWTLAYTDKAGNKATDLENQSFCVDLTKPAITISGINPNSANNTDGNIGFAIECTDTNFGTFTPVLTAVVYENGSFATKEIEGSASSVGNGERIEYGNLEEDGMYSLRCAAVDKAGNAYDTVNIVDEDGVTSTVNLQDGDNLIDFSVNRNGSTFALNDYSMDVVNDYYVQETAEDIVFYETNADELLNYNIKLNGNALKEGNDYKVTESGGDGSWYRYEYAVNKSLFDDEGEYNLVVESEDKATSMAYSDLKNVSADFVIDKTAPTFTISGIEEDGNYRGTSQNVTLVPTDDGGKLGHVKVTILDKDGKEQKVISDMSGDELTKYLNGNDGKIKFKVPEGVNQQVAILCADCSIGTDGGTNTTDFIYKGITVSSNAFILFFENKPLFYGVLGVVAAAIIVPTGFVIYKKKRKTKKEASEQ